MSKGDRNLCMGCMSPLEGDGVCRLCHYNNSDPRDPDYLAPGTLLNSRYLIGSVQRRNGEGATYAGYDNSLSKRVWVREYFPTALSRRQESGQLIPIPGMGAQYKALMSDFQDMCNEVRRLSISDAVIPILDAFLGNDTVYAVFDDLGVRPLEEYLVDHGGKLSLEETQRLITPLLNTVDNIHAQGSIHRGLSPYTIYIDDNDRLYLWDFALAPTRTAKSELIAELFNGFSAPEQYSANGWQGSWTDVYALGALLYRILTGFVPPKAVMRSPDRPQATLSELTDVPDYISQAVENAMALSTGQRTQGVGTLSSQLFQTASENTMTYDSLAREKKEMARRRARERAEKRRASFRNALYVILALLVTTLLLFGCIWFYVTNYGNGLIESSASSVSSGPELSVLDDSSEEPAPDNKVPLFVGRKLDDVQDNDAYTDRYEFIIKYEFNEVYDEGTIVNQSPFEGTVMINKGNVTLYVSKGKEELEVPDLAAKTRAEAMVILTDEGIPYEILEKVDASAEPDTVLNTIPAAGTKIDPKRDTVIVVVSPPAHSSSSQDDTEIIASSSRPPSLFDGLDLPGDDD